MTPNRAHNRFCRDPLVLPGQPVLESVPWRPFSADAGDPAAAHRRAPPPAVASAAAAPPDPLRAVGSESDDPDPIQARVKPDPYRSTLVHFAKEPFCVAKINPRSTHVQKYLQGSPLFSGLAPELLQNRIRSPA